MSRYVVFARNEYAEPLAKVGEAEHDDTPGLDDLDVGDDWLELTVVPEDALIWVLRDGELVDEWQGAVA